MGFTPAAFWLTDTARYDLHNMPKRQAVAEFLLGFFAFPVCALFGVMEVFLFHWTHTQWKAILCVAFFALFPLAGAIKTRQKSLIAGQIAGLVATLLIYLALK